MTGKEQADLPDKEEIPELPSVSDQMKDAGTDLKEEKDRQERAEETKEDRRETAGEKDRTEGRVLEKRIEERSTRVRERDDRKGNAKKKGK